MAVADPVQKGQVVVAGADSIIQMLKGRMGAEGECCDMLYLCGCHDEHD